MNKPTTDKEYSTHIKIATKTNPCLYNGIARAPENKDIKKTTNTIVATKTFSLKTLMILFFTVSLLF